MTTAYPLSWPPGFPRTTNREKGKFRTTLSSALENVTTSLRLFGHDSGKPVSQIVLSSNVTLGSTSPADPGVAAWFIWEAMQICIPVDRYSTVSANLQAIHHVLEARRVELRHGTLALVRATFAGFKALPAPAWRSILGLGPNAGLAEAEAAWKRLAKEAHPDQPGGSSDRMTHLNVAIQTARKELCP